MLSIIVVVALGFTVFYLVCDNEEIYLSTSSIYVSKGDDFDIDINFKNKKSYTDYEIIVGNNAVVKYNEENDNFTALDGGYTKVLFRTDNVNYRNLDCVVYVGDGNPASPFYITTAEQLLQIGKADADGNVKYPLDACYSLRNDISLDDLAEENLGYWSPIGYNVTDGTVSEFTGSFDGRGYTIVNMNLDKAAFNQEVDDSQSELAKQNYTSAGLFAKLGANSIVKNLKFENATITGEYTYAGVLAGEAYTADIERIEIKSATLDLKNTGVAGTVVGKNASTVVSQAFTSSSLDRVSAVVNVVSPSKVFGGLVGENLGGYIVYSYATGTAELYNEYANVTFGGIVGTNKTISATIDSRTVYSGASVKDCYTNFSFTYTLPESVTTGNVDNINAGMIIGENISGSKTKDYGAGDVTIELNKIIGNYYNSDTAKVVYDTTTKTYTGIYASKTLAGSALSKVDAEYKVVGATEINMKKASTYKSHVSGEDVIAWKFGTVWIEAENSFPILDYAEQAVSPEIDGMEDAETATDAERFLELLDDPETTSIVIGSDLDFSGYQWEAKPINIKIYADYDDDKTGSNGEKVYYRLKNLNTNSVNGNVSVEIAALFSVIGKDAELHNITIENATFTNGKYSAGFAKENLGYIYDCAIVNSSIVGREAAAGIAIDNSGEIAMSKKDTVVNGNNVPVYGNGVKVTDTVIKVEINESNEVLTGNVNAAGIAVTNTGTISGVVVKGTTENHYIKVRSTGTSANAKVSGAVVGNYGTLNNVNVSFVAGSVGIKAEGTFAAKAAGLAIENKSRIANSYVSANISTYNANERNASAGLVVDVVENGYVEYCGFYGNNKTIEGYTVGGLAVNLSQTALRKISINGWDAAWNTIKLTTSKEDMGNGIIQSFVAGSTVVKGKSVAGLVNSITNGAVIDCYVGTGVTLTGVDSGSEVANLAMTVSINYTGKETFSTGIIAYCYSDAKFNNSGKSYGVAKADILEGAVNQSKKSAGYGVGIIVSSSNTSGTTFYDDSDWNPKNWGKDGQSNCKTDAGTMHTNSGDSNKFRDFGFAADIWSFDTNQLGDSKGEVGPSLYKALIDTTYLLVD